MLILAIDPGRTTGICVISTDSAGGFQVESAYEMLWEDRFVTLTTLIGRTPEVKTASEPLLPGAVVIETFRLRQGRAYEQSGSDFPSTQIIAIVQTLLWQDGRLDALKFQEPSIISRVTIEPKHLSWTGSSPHVRDAYRHARFYFLAHIRTPY